MKNILQDQFIRNNGIFSIVIFNFGLMGFLILLALDKFYWSSGLLDENWPNFSYGHLFRSVIIFISFSAISWSLIIRNQLKMILIEGIGIPFERLIVLGALFLAILFLTLFLINPTVFSTSSEEDGPIEWGSALLLLSGSLIFVISFIRFRKSLNIPLIVRCTFLFFALIFFIIAMEEISWFQRFLKFQTSNLLNHNSQNEFNFHNVATSLFENIYYFGTFLFLMVLPLVWRLVYNELNSDYAKLFVPRPFITIICAVTCAYNFDMWNILFTQISFFGAIVILFIFYKFTNNGHEKFMFIFTIFLVVITQIFFLLNGERFMRPWEVTEYKEFFIPLAFFGYSVSVYNYVSQVYLAERS